MQCYNSDEFNMRFVGALAISADGHIRLYALFNSRREGGAVLYNCLGGDVWLGL